MNTVAIVGVGLIGGSFALALRAAGFKGEILGVSSPATLERARAMRAVDDGVTLGEAAARADLLYLAQPIEAILKTIEQLQPLVRPGCLVTDAGSTKTEIVDRADRYLPPGSFLGGHPLAGKEQRGVEHADASLFRGRPYVLTPPEQDLAAASEFRAWLTRMGAHVISMTPQEHDVTVSFTSHLPQILSTVLALSLGATERPYVTQAYGPGLLDMTRLALSTPEIWRSIITTNRRAISEALAAFKFALEQSEARLLAGDVEQIFREGARFAAEIRKTGESA